MKLGLFRDKTPPLGTLERDVLDHLWTTDAPATAKQVHAALSDSHGKTLSTIQSTLERLARKRLLRRDKQGRSYVYQPVMSRESLVGRMVAELAHELAAPSAAATLSGLLDLEHEVDDATLDRLERWVAQQRGKRP